MYAVWLGTQTDGNGPDWKLALKDPMNGVPVTVPKEHYTHMAIVIAYKCYPYNPTITHWINGSPTNNFTTLRVGEVYDSGGNRIQYSGMIHYSGETRIFPISVLNGSTTYTLDVGPTFTIPITWA